MCAYTQTKMPNACREMGENNEEEDVEGNS